jgi:hypothetical protein
MLTRIIGWALVAFAVYFLLTDPAGAAGVAHSALDGLRHAANQLSQFGRQL